MHSKFVPLLASAWLLTFPFQNSSAIPIIHTVGASANRSEPSLGINTALMTSLSGTSFTLDEIGQSSIRPAERLRADRQDSMAVSYGQSFSLSRSMNEPMLDARNFVHKDITATLDLLGPSTPAGLTGSASQGNGSVGRTSSLEQTNFARGVVDQDSPMRRVILADSTFTTELALNTETRPKDKAKGTSPVVKVLKDKDKDKPPVIIVPTDEDNDNGPVYSVPDTGSTALLLGTAILALGVARRRFAPR